MRTDIVRRVGVRYGAAMVLAGLALSASAQGMRGLPDFTDLYERAAASVVSIETKQKVRRAGGAAVRWSSPSSRCRFCC